MADILIDNAVMADARTLATQLSAKQERQLAANALATGSVARSLEDKLGEAISVIDFGAVGDGVTDDSAAWRRAISYASASGAIVQGVPDQTYLCNDLLLTNDLPLPLEYIFLINQDNVRIDLRGATMRTTVNARQWLIGGHYKSGAAFVRSDTTYGGAPYTLYAVNPAAKGSSTLTLATAGDASNFQVGDWVFPRTGETLTTDPTSAHPFGEFTQIVAISGATLTLRYPMTFAMAQLTYPTGHVLVGQNVVWGIVNVSRPIDSLVKNFMLWNGNLVGGSGLTVPFFSGNQNTNADLRNLSLECYGHGFSTGWSNAKFRDIDILLRGSSVNGYYSWSTDSGNVRTSIRGLRAQAPLSISYIHLHEGSSAQIEDFRLTNGPGTSNSTSISVRTGAHDVILKRGTVRNSGTGAPMIVDATVVNFFAEDLEFDIAGTGRVYSIDTLDYVLKNVRTGGKKAYAAPRLSRAVERNVFLPAYDFGLFAGTPTFGLIHNSRWVGWLLDATTDESVAATVSLPGDWVSVYMVPLLSSDSAGDVRIQCEIRGGVDGMNIDAAAIGTVATTLTLVADIVKTNIAALASPQTLLAEAPTSFYQIKVNRDADNAADTLAADCAFLGLYVVRYE